METEFSYLPVDQVTATELVAKLQEYPDISTQVPLVQNSAVYKQGFRLHSLDSLQAIASLPVALHTQAHGVFNGGANALLGETTASLAASVAAPSGKIAVGTHISVQHLRPVRHGYVYCVAQQKEITESWVQYALHFFATSGEYSAQGTLRCAFITPS